MSLWEKENKYITRKPLKKSGGITRRGFLGLAGLGTAIAATGVGAKCAYDWLTEADHEDTQISEGKDTEPGVEVMADDNQTSKAVQANKAAEVHIGDVQSEKTKTVFESLNIRTFEDLQRPIEINRQTFEATVQAWEARYLEKGRDDLVNAYESLTYWSPCLKAAIAKELKDQPLADQEFMDDMMLLAIAESTGKFREISKAWARGLFQITDDAVTDIKMQLKEQGASAKEVRRYAVTSTYDFREDPVLAAEFAGKCFKDLFKRFRNKDLAISGYNGSQINRYREQRIRENQVGVSYDDFLAYVEGDIRSIQKYAADMNQPSLKYIAKKKDTWKKLSKWSGVTPDQLMKANPRLSKPGPEQEIAIPLPADPEARLQFVQRYASGYVENLTYPAKIYGMKRAAQKLGLGQVFKEKKMQWSEVPIRSKVLEVKVGKNETLEGVLRRIHALSSVDKTSVSLYSIKQANGLKSDKIKAGQKLRIPVLFAPNKLCDFSPDSETQKDLLFLNPAIEDAGCAFPATATIRIPEGSKSLIRDGRRVHERLETL